jgi:hypothetical protein
MDLVHVPGSAPSKAELVGKIGETEIKLHQSHTENSGCTYLFGRLTADGNQTRFRCRIAIRPLVIAFLIVWFGVVLFLGLEAIAEGHGTLKVNFFGYRTVFEGWWAGVATPFLFLCFGVAALVRVYFSARDDEKFLIDFLRKTIDARDA